MSLYDDIEMEKTAPTGWASGLKLMPNQMAFKKASFAGTRRDQRRGNTKLAPVIDLKSRREDDDSSSPPVTTQMLLAAAGRAPVNDPPVSVVSGTIGQTDPEWRFINEYHPQWPNDYEKVVRDMRERRDREEKEKRQQEREEREKKWRGQSNVTLSHEGGGFSGRPRDSDSEDDEEADRPKRAGGVGAAIAPPSSLDAEGPVKPPLAGGGGAGLTFNKFGGSSIAAKIMAKYGFKEGQGLGKSEQGIVRALEVEKTSKRGGRIVTERDEAGPPSPPAGGGGPAGTPPHPASSDDGFAAPMGPPPPPPKISGPDKPEPNIADMLKCPSKVAVLRNMVGPGEVDDDLEPEVREECREKYGAVVQVLIFQIPRAAPHEAVRIFVEFQRVEAAIKAVIDLNGRFFGGRQVSAGFYDHANFKAFKLNEPIS